MDLRDSLRNNGQKSSSIIKAREKAINQILDKRQVKKSQQLEIFLNNQFYPKESTKFSSEYDNLIKQHLHQTEKEIMDRFNAFDFNAVKLKQKYKKQIAKTTFETLIGQAQLLLDQIKNVKIEGSTEEAREILKSLIDEGNKILDSLEQTNSYFITKKMDKNIIDIANSLEIYISFFRQTPSSKDLGDAFENTLVKLRNILEDQVIPTVVDRKILETLETDRHGDKVVSRGDINLQYSMKISNIKKIFNNNPSKNIKISENGLTATYSYNPSIPKQGKMDVSFKYQTGNKKYHQYRISAKRWGTGRGDLGRTNLLAALARSAGEQSAIQAYCLNVLNPEKDLFGKGVVVNKRKTDAAHNFAELAIKADIAMGLSQGEGYADTLVIDTGSSIKVYNIVDIIRNKKLSGYNGDAIDSEAIKIYKTIKPIRKARTTAYYIGMFSMLEKMEVTMYL